MDNPRYVPPRHFLFDGTPEIHATDANGGFSFPLKVDGESFLPTSEFDEVRFVFSLWHPSSQRSIDLDRAYVELRASFESTDDHWIKIAEIEPVVAPYSGGEAFDGWIVLPVLGRQTAFMIIGSGFEPRARLQIKASAYMVA